MKRKKHQLPPILMRSIAPPSKGKIAHRIIWKVTHEGREYTFHATKGYRSTRS